MPTAKSPKTITSTPQFQRRSWVLITAALIVGFIFLIFKLTFINLDRPLTDPNALLSPIPTPTSTVTPPSTDHNELSQILDEHCQKKEKQEFNYYGDPYMTQFEEIEIDKLPVIFSTWVKQKFIINNTVRCAGNKSNLAANLWYDDGTRYLDVGNVTHSQYDGTFESSRLLTTSAQIIHSQSHPFLEMSNGVLFLFSFPELPACIDGKLWARSWGDAHASTFYSCLSLASSTPEKFYLVIQPSDGVPYSPTALEFELFGYKVAPNGNSAVVVSSRAFVNAKADYPSLQTLFLTYGTGDEYYSLHRQEDVDTLESQLLSTFNSTPLFTQMQAEVEQVLAGIDWQ